MTDKETRERELLELIADAENLATVHAKEYGETYNSTHEAYNILQEEIREVEFEIQEIKTIEEYMAPCMKDERRKPCKVCSNTIKTRAQKGIVELLHVIAVCNKIEGMK